jgi:hypothetical protein
VSRDSLALPITAGTAKFPGIRIHDTRMIRLMETLLHGGTTVGGWRAKDIQDAVLTAFGITADRYGLNQLRCDLRKSDKGTRVALMFVLFHKQLCGPLANSLFHHQPDPASRPKSKLENAFHKADDSIPNIIQLVEAA